MTNKKQFEASFGRLDDPIPDPDEPCEARCTCGLEELVALDPTYENYEHDLDCPARE